MELLLEIDWQDHSFMLLSMGEAQMGVDLAIRQAAASRTFVNRLRTRPHGQLRPDFYCRLDHAAPHGMQSGIHISVKACISAKIVGCTRAAATLALPSPT